ncbi:hypothetical protein FH972_021009 [Carpinus fangiana]|uniref:GH64 domain-containing protein n=1 Tax=Carpinus fangiana TaxID=176857 RepID=A0A5N6KNN5_9ROSI|nr:hypothetical protein FH972_021009 [Carpinus fangiana]
MGAAQALVMPSYAGLAIRDGPYNSTVVHPTNRRLTTKDNTFNSTFVTQSVQDAPAAPVTLALSNNLNGAGQINAYITGTDPTSGQVIFIKADGSVYQVPNPAQGEPTQQIDPASITIPLGAYGSVTNVVLSQYITSARVWFGVGDLWFGANYGDAGPGIAAPYVADPNDRSAGVNWGFAEFNWNAELFFANISYVDFVGLLVSLILTEQSGTVTKALGAPADGVNTVCQGLRTQHDTDGQPWDQLCVNDASGNLLRVISPAKLPSTDTGFANYWSAYVDQVYDSFASNPLTINTKTAAGDLTGTYNAGSGNLEFPGYSYAKPNAFDIWGCADGPYFQPPDDTARALVASLCAAFQRTTYLINGGNVQPNGVTDMSQYYAADPTNHYSKVVHAAEVDGRGYAFPYDDVVPDGGQDVAGTVAAADAQTLLLSVGAPPA